MLREGGLFLIGGLALLRRRSGPNSRLADGCYRCLPVKRLQQRRALSYTLNTRLAVRYKQNTREDPIFGVYLGFVSWYLAWRPWGVLTTQSSDGSDGSDGVLQVFSKRVLLQIKVQARFLFYRTFEGSFLQSKSPGLGVLPCPKTGPFSGISLSQRDTVNAPVSLSVSVLRLFSFCS